MRVYQALFLLFPPEPGNESRLEHSGPTITYFKFSFLGTEAGTFYTTKKKHPALNIPFEVHNHSSGIAAKWWKSISEYKKQQQPINTATLQAWHFYYYFHCLL